MMHANAWIFENFWKNEISGAEYAADRENAAENQVGDNGFCSKSVVQNVEKLDFSKSFESA